MCSFLYNIYNESKLGVWWSFSISKYDKDISLVFGRNILRAIKIKQFNWWKIIEVVGIDDMPTQYVLKNMFRMHITISTSILFHKIFCLVSSVSYCCDGLPGWNHQKEVFNCVYEVLLDYFYCSLFVMLLHSWFKVMKLNIIGLSCGNCLSRNLLLFYLQRLLYWKMQNLQAPPPPSAPLLHRKVLSESSTRLVHCPDSSINFWATFISFLGNNCSFVLFRPIAAIPLWLHNAQPAG